MTEKEIRKTKQKLLKDVVVNGRVYRQVFQDLTKNLAAIEDRERTAWGNSSYFDFGNRRIPMRIVDMPYVFIDLVQSGYNAEDGILPPVENIIAEGIRETERKNSGFRDLNLNGLLLLHENHYRMKFDDKTKKGGIRRTSHDEILFALCRYEEKPRPIPRGQYQWQTLCTPKGNFNLRG